MRELGARERRDGRGGGRDGTHGDGFGGAGCAAVKRTSTQNRRRVAKNTTHLVNCRLMISCSLSPLSSACTSRCSRPSSRQTRISRKSTAHLTCAISAAPSAPPRSSKTTMFLRSGRRCMFAFPGEEDDREGKASARSWRYALERMRGTRKRWLTPARASAATSSGVR